HSQHSPRALACYSRPSKLPFRLGPVHCNTHNSSSGRTNLAELDEFVEFFLVSLGDGFHLTFRKISYPAGNSESPRLFSYLPSEENSLDYTADQNSGASSQS